MDRWGDDWNQTAHVLSLLYAQKGVETRPSEIIPNQRKPKASPVDMGRKLMVGFKALAAAMQRRKKDG